MSNEQKSLSGLIRGGLDVSDTGKLNYLETNYSHKKSTNPYDFLLVQYILDLGSIKPGGSVLDLACGPGSFRSVFEKFNFSYVGVDIDNESEANNIIKCDIANQKLPFVDDEFDFIFFKMGIEHLSVNEISKCLSEALRTLKRGGSFVVITPDWKWNYKLFYDEYTHQTPFTVSSLTSALKMARYDVKLCESIIQLPIVWKYPFIKILSDVAYLLYPILKKVKFIKYSKERPLLAIAKKP